MPDASHPFPENVTPGAAPRDWGDAFNALPLEAPPADAWARLAPQLHARRASRARPAWLGLAAAAAVVAVIAWPRQGTVVETPQVVKATPAPSRPMAAATKVATPTPPPPQPAGATQVATQRPATPQEIAHPAQRIAARAAPTTGSAATPDRLRDLQAESARLEALLAYARDERVGSASAMLLADAFDAQVADIDAALVAPGLEAPRREALWQARVDALQQAAGFVSTQRLLATQGRTDSLLVSVD